MVAFGWLLLAHAVDIETWLRLVPPHTSVDPLAAILLVAIGAAVALIVVRAAVRGGRADSSIVLVAWSERSASPPRAEPRGRVSVMLASGHGSRAPGRSVRRPVSITPSV
jgi:hypothetical protein